MLKSHTGERVIVLCAWCKKELRLRRSTVRSRLKNATNICCGVNCSAKYHTFVNDRKKYGKRILDSNETPGVIYKP